MGGGDLNLKKSWHTQTIKNIEKVWKKERENEEEKKKMEQLRRELAEERQLAELQKMQEQAGLIKKKSDRLDWMYAGSSHSNAELQEEYLLGKKRVDKEITSSDTLVPNSLSAENVNNDRDSMAKIREDPMLLIKRKEQLSLKEILDNPIRLKQLREMKEKRKRHNGKDGKDRHNGEDGRHRHNGEDGRHRHNDEDGKDRRNGEEGKDRRNGEEGKDRRNGEDSRNRRNGEDSRHRHNGEDGKDRHNGNSRKGVTSSMSKEEREARLAQMKADASLVSSIRQKKLEEDIKRDEEEQRMMQAKRKRQEDAEFLGDVKRSATNISTVSERVSRNIHYIQRGSDDSGSKFTNR